MSNPCYNAARSDIQAAHDVQSEREGVDRSSFTQNSQGNDLVCQKSTCTNLRFSNWVEFRSHILTHISLPKVLVKKLDVKSIGLKNCFSPQTESLKVRLKLKASSGSDKPTFEVVPSKRVLSGPGGLFSLYGLEENIKVECLEGINSSQIGQASERRSRSRHELDGHSATTADTERDISDGGRSKEQEEEDQDEGEQEDNEEEEEEEEEETEQDAEEDIEQERRSTATRPVSSPLSPTPSEVLRPQGYLAPEQLVDDDSCYPRSPPGSPTRMVEMNGSVSTVGGSDNDSGHSRSPAAFTGGAGIGSGGEEDNTGQQSFNWDELVSQSSENENSGTANSAENGRAEGSPAEVANSVASSGIGADGEASSMLENDPLLLPDNSSSGVGEQENMNLLQNLTSDPLQSDVDRGDTEYMPLDQLGEAFCCEVCGERTQDRQMLEEHRALVGHYKCLMPECSQIIWSSTAELAAHQSSVHGITQPSTQQQQALQQSPPPQTSPQAASGTPPVEQLAQQVQRLPIPPQGGYPPISSPQYPVSVPQQSLSPQLSAQMSPQMVPQLGPPMPGQMPPRRPAMNFRMPLQAQPFGPGSPGQQQPGFSGTIQPRPLNTLVAQQPVRGQMLNRMPSGAAIGAPQGAIARGMTPMPMRGQKRPGVMPQPAGRGIVPPAVKQRRLENVAPQADVGPGKKSDAKAVANILATRGITVTPAGAGVGRPSGPGPQSVQARRQQMMAPAPPQAATTTLNLNSAISIIPTSAATGARQQNSSGFAVPQGRLQRQPQTTNVERPPRPPTVDLTGDGPPPPPPGSTRLQMTPTFHRGRGRPSNLARAACQICDKVFSSPEMLSQHMVLHRSPGKLPFRCNLCNAQYPTQQGLQQHRQTYHKEAVGMGSALVPGEEMVIPLVDLKQPGVAARLGALGIHHCIPLSGLGNQSNGYFSLPIVSIDGSRTSAAGNLRSLGATGVLSIGPIKLVPR